MVRGFKRLVFVGVSQPCSHKTDAATRGNILLKIADRIEQNLELLAHAETVDNGKAIRETLNAHIPLTVDHFRYFAGCVRAQEGALSNIDENTVAYHIQEPLGVVGQAPLGGDLEGGYSVQPTSSDANSRFSIGMNRSG